MLLAVVVVLAVSAGFAAIFDESTAGITLTGGASLEYESGGTPATTPNVILLPFGSSSAYADITLQAGQQYIVSARRRTFSSGNLQFKIDLDGQFFVLDLAHSPVGGEGTYQEVTYEGLYVPNDAVTTVRIYDSGSWDARVDYIQFEIGTLEVCGDPGTVYLPEDFSRNCYVDLADIVMFGQAWLRCTAPDDPDCPGGIAVMAVNIDSGQNWVYAGGQLTFSAMAENDILGDPFYLYTWESPVNQVTGQSLILVSGGGPYDTTATYQAPQAAEDYLVTCRMANQYGSNASTEVSIEVRNQ